MFNKEAGTPFAPPLCKWCNPCLKKQHISSCQWCSRVTSKGVLLASHWLEIWTRVSWFLEDSHDSKKTYYSELNKIKAKTKKKVSGGYTPAFLKRDVFVDLRSIKKPAEELFIYPVVFEYLPCSCALPLLPATGHRRDPERSIYWYSVTTHFGGEISGDRPVIRVKGVGYSCGSLICSSPTHSLSTSKAAPLVVWICECFPERNSNFSFFWQGCLMKLPENRASPSPSGWPHTC